MNETWFTSKLSEIRHWAGLFLGAAIFTFAFTVAAGTNTVTLAWMPNLDASTAGYQIYYQADANPYVSVVDAGAETRLTVTNLDDSTTYHFRVAAYDTNNNFSAASVLTDYTTPKGPIITNLPANGPVTNTNNGTNSVVVTNGGGTNTNGISGTNGNTQTNITITNQLTNTNGSVTNQTTNVVSTITNSDFLLTTVGSGALTPNPNVTHTVLTKGKKYTFLATPAKGNLFAGWYSNGLAVMTSTRYTVIPASNVVIQARFVPNPFTPVVGSYHGLFYVSSNAAPESSGAFSATVAASGAFSAKLQLGAKMYSLSSTFTTGGTLTKTINRPGLSALTVGLSLDLTNGVMLGSVSDGNWTANLIADQLVYSHTNPAPLAGKYTMAIPGSTNAGEPAGNGYGAVVVSSLGTVVFSGVLGDGSAVSSSSIVTSAGNWPLFASLYHGAGATIGWMNFTNDTISGQLGWFKTPQVTSKYYPSGFTCAPEVVGSTYQYSTPVLSFAQGDLTLIYGNLDQPITGQAVIGAANATADASTNKFVVNPATGLFRGTVSNPATGKPITVNGVVLQKQNLAAGLFLGSSETGSALVEAAQ